MARHRLSSLRGFVILVLLVPLGFLVADAGRQGLADLVALEARHGFERWVDGRSAAEPAVVDAFLVEFAKALALAPENPRLIEDLGRFHAMRAERTLADVSHAHDDRQQSLAYFRRALAVRPTSPYAALSVAQMKFRLGQIDREFSFALTRSLDLGPWDPAIQIAAIRLGLAAWQGLPEAVQGRLAMAVRNQLDWRQVDQRSALVPLLKAYGRHDLLGEAAEAK